MICIPQFLGYLVTQACNEESSIYIEFEPPIGNKQKKKYIFNEQFRWLKEKECNQDKIERCRMKHVNRSTYKAPTRVNKLYIWSESFEYLK